MENRPVRLIATDVDGTLLNSGGILPERNLKAIRAAREQGITVAIASGRFPENVYVLLENYGLRCPIIGTNGAKIVDENLKLISETCMDQETAFQVLETLIQMNADYFIFGDHCVCTSAASKRHHSELSQGERIKSLGIAYFRGPEQAREIVRGKVYKFFIGNSIPLQAVRERLALVPGIELTQSNNNNLEVMPRGVHKGAGVQKLAEVLSVPIAQVMTLGDENNDIPMLRLAGVSVAMGNGAEQAKEAAMYVTAANDACGFADAVEKYALR